jgi:glutathione S-transferase
VLHRIAMRVRGFEGTVPGVVVDGRKVHGSSAILRALDDLVPEPRLYPTDPAGRAAVAEAVSWGERVYQRNELISQGVLNADEPGAADLKIAPTTRALPVVGGSPPAARAA